MTEIEHTAILQDLSMGPEELTLSSELRATFETFDSLPEPATSQF